MKVRVSYLLDLAQIAPNAVTEADTTEVVRQLAWNAARATHKRKLTDIRTSSMGKADKDRAVAEQLAAIMFTLMGEANTTIEVVADDTVIGMCLPFEQSSGN